MTTPVTTVTVTVADKAGRSGTADITLVSPPTPAPAAKPFPVAFSVLPPSGSWLTAGRTLLKAGATGLVRYVPAGTRPGWTADLAALAVDLPLGPLMLQYTAKTHDDAGLRDLLTYVPKWDLLYNIWQEPEDNVANGSLDLAKYRAAYHSAADVYRALSRTDRPWLELQEFWIGRTDQSAYLPAADDYDGVLWSIANYSGSVVDIPAKVTAQVARISTWMAANAPGKRWGAMMLCYTVPASGATDAQRAAQAAYYTVGNRAVRAAGGVCGGWFDANYGKTGAAGNSRVANNPLLAQAVTAFAAEVAVR